MAAEVIDFFDVINSWFLVLVVVDVGVVVVVGGWECDDRWWL